MIQTYVEGKDLYSAMAAKVFSLLAIRTAEELNERNRKRQLNTGDPVHGLAPIRQQLYKDKFIYEVEGEYVTKSLNPEDCYDGTLYRKMMKTLLLGILYGMSYFGLAARLKVSEEDAKDIIADFYRAFPSVKRVMNELKKLAYKDGYVETEWGRKRRIPDVWDENKWVRKKAERQLFNSKIQGGAADLMKRAMGLVSYDPRLLYLQFKSLLTVHDELIGSVPKADGVAAAKLLVEDMIACAKLLVPLKVDAELYYQGAWNGDSIQLKGSKGNYRLIHEKEPISEEDYLDLVG